MTVHVLAAPTRRWPRWPALSLLLLLLGTLPTAAAQVQIGEWYQFSFEAGDVRGCFPEDLQGAFCVPSSGTLTLFAPEPSWTFNLGPGGGTLVVTDAFLSGDEFEVFDLATLSALGATSAPTGGVDCGDDPEVCLATAGMSIGSFALAPGAHAIALETSSDSGSGYFKIVERQVPEPATLVLAAAGLAGWCARRRVRTRRDP